MEIQPNFCKIMNFIRFETKLSSDASGFFILCPISFVLTDFKHCVIHSVMSSNAMNLVN